MSNDFKLFGTVFIEERDGNPHFSIIVTWNGIGIGHFDSIIILIVDITIFALDFLVATEFQVIGHGH